MQFFKEYHELNANIAFFPLITNVFNVGKSSISLLEATYAGSAFIGCKNLPEFNHDFVIDLYDEDLLSFELVKDNFELLERRNNQAWQWICDERLLSKINQLRINRLLDV
jgi:hypothetical protein